jgi:nucleoid DNA-binding protein
MNIGKKNIAKNITKNSLISIIEARSILQFFLTAIISKSKSNRVKLSGFGTFVFKKTPKRIGRNPKTKDSYIIPELNKLNFKPSKKITDIIN